MQAVIASGNTQLQAAAINPTMSVAEYSIPLFPDGTMFGTLDDARRLIGLCRGRLPSGHDGTAVNVVLIDAGIDKTMFPPGRYGGGWQCLPQGPGMPTPQPPGMTTGEDALHGMMIVNDILAIAPKVTIWDVPLIPPPKVYDIPSFLIAANAVFSQILADILAWQSGGLHTGPWIFMNAWAVYDWRLEADPIWVSMERKSRRQWIAAVTSFIATVEQIANAGLDLEVCAGNCGERLPG